MAVRVLILTTNDGKGNAKQCRLNNWLSDYGENCSIAYGHSHLVGASVYPDLIVSYNYAHKVPKAILNKVPGINLHIGYLPWNKGAYPVLWSALQRTPMGVTIHWMDENIDTGQVIVQERVRYNEHDTLRHIYDRCHRHIQHLFMSHWFNITEIVGNRHYKFEQGALQLRDGWDTTVEHLRGDNITPRELSYANKVAYGGE
jgi:methionyl-tRNA formyltransferase